MVFCKRICAYTDRANPYRLSASPCSQSAAAHNWRGNRPRHPSNKETRLEFVCGNRIRRTFGEYVSPVVMDKLLTLQPHLRFGERHSQICGYRRSDDGLSAVDAIAR